MHLKKCEISKTLVSVVILLPEAQIISMAGAGDLPLDEGFIAVLVLLLVLLLSTGYVYIQQAPGAAAAAAAANNNNAAAARAGAPRPSALRTTAPDAIPTAGLSDALLRLHRALPTRHGARTATLCADALLRRKEDADAQWVSADAAAALSDLLQLADVYVLCVVRDAGDRAVMERVRALLAESGSDGRRLQSHKVLFCTTAVGKVAFVRQLEPQLHIEGQCVWC